MEISVFFIFASEEYNEFVGEYFDVFGFFLDGDNIATVGDNADIVSVQTIDIGQCFLAFDPMSDPS